nr:DUF262 domain-containing protein [Nocardioides perillae]
MFDVLNHRLLRVAEYQRPYAWESKQLADLWGDLDLVGKDAHYAGTLVLQKTGAPVVESSAGTDLTTFEVVDGQQRLTTCILLLDRLRLALEKVDPASHEGLAEAVADLKRLVHVRVDGVDRVRLELASELDHYWAQNLLQGVPYVGTIMVGGQQRLKAAAEFFEARLHDLVEGVDESLAAERLIDLKKRVGRLRFLVYPVESSAEVGVLFETLNERGQSLTELEKVKNYLLYLARQLPPGQQEALGKEIQRAWAEIFRNTAAFSWADDAVLRAHWLATQDPRPREWKGTASIKAKFPRSRYVPGSVRLEAVGRPVLDEDKTATWDSLYNDVRDYVSTLERCSAYFRDLHSEGAAYDGFAAADAQEARRWNAALARSDVQFPFRPLLFAARLRYPSDGAFYAELTRLCEHFSARVFAICRFRSNGGQNDLSRAAHELYTGAKSQAEILDSMRRWIWAWAPDERVELAFRLEEDWYGRRSHKYVLYEYELYLSGKASTDARPWRDFMDSRNRKTTEHILPQHPDADSQWLQDFPGDQHRRLVNSLGNLVLTYDNSSYRNFEYTKKRGVEGQGTCYYSVKATAGERHIASTYGEWTPASVRHRLDEIRVWALARWHVDPVVDAEADEDPFEEGDVPVEEVQTGGDG